MAVETPMGAPGPVVNTAAAATQFPLQPVFISVLWEIVNKCIYAFVVFIDTLKSSKIFLRLLKFEPMSYVRCEML
jgi:hypothetical protein